MVEREGSSSIHYGLLTVATGNRAQTLDLEKRDAAGSVLRHMNSKEIG